MIVSGNSCRFIAAVSLFLFVELLRRHAHDPALLIILPASLRIPVAPPQSIVRSNSSSNSADSKHGNIDFVDDDDCIVLNPWNSSRRRQLQPSPFNANDRRERRNNNNNEEEEVVLDEMRGGGDWREEDKETAAGNEKNKYYNYKCNKRRTGNPMDDCWRCGGGDMDWKEEEELEEEMRERKRLAGCGMGFGREARGGVEGRMYVVTRDDGDDAVDPRPGTLRHAVIQEEPLWVVFSRDMNITLSQELLINSHKTIDGRGHQVHVSRGACLTLQNVSHIIIHGIHVHDCRPTGPAMVRSSPSHVGWRTVADGDAISLFAATHVWIDHCSLSRSADGLIDAVFASTAITLSNNLFSHHDKVMLLGHSDSYLADKAMQVTIAFNRFGQGLVQRMPRCRHGFFEIVNNDYLHWEMYAIGGSASPTINSKGNRYVAPSNPFAKDVTMRIYASQEEWETWDWRSEGDMFLNGAYFTQSGALTSTNLEKAATIVPKSSSLVALLTADAGALSCNGGLPYQCIQASPSSYFPGQSYPSFTSSSPSRKTYFYDITCFSYSTWFLLYSLIVKTHHYGWS